MILDAPLAEAIVWNVGALAPPEMTACPAVPATVPAKAEVDDA